jgi:hypothetical protein
MKTKKCFCETESYNCKSYRLCKPKQNKVLQICEERALKPRVLCKTIKLFVSLVYQKNCDPSRLFWKIRGCGTVGGFDREMDINKNVLILSNCLETFTTENTLG